MPWKYKPGNLSEPLQEESGAIVWRKEDGFSLSSQTGRIVLQSGSPDVRRWLGVFLEGIRLLQTTVFPNHLQKQPWKFLQVHQGLSGWWTRTLQGRKQRPPPAQEHPRESEWSSSQSPASPRTWREERSSSCLGQKEENQDEKVTRWRGGEEVERRRNEAYCPGPHRGRWGWQAGGWSGCHGGSHAGPRGGSRYCAPAERRGWRQEKVEAPALEPESNWPACPSPSLAYTAPRWNTHLWLDQSSSMNIDVVT